MPGILGDLGSATLYRVRESGICVRRNYLFVLPDKLQRAPWQGWPPSQLPCPILRGGVQVYLLDKILTVLLSHG